MTKTVCGNNTGLAPEIIERSSENDKYNAEKIDIFNLGILFYAILFKKLPFNITTTREKYLEAIKKQDIDF